MSVISAEDDYMENAAKEIIARLVEKAQTGDRRAFSEIVKRLMTQVTALTYRMTGDKDAALDLAQETFVTGWLKLGDFRGEAGFASWLYRIASNKTLNYLKSAKAVEPFGHEVALESKAPGPDQVLIRKELAGKVADFMATLPPQQRLIFELRFYKEMSFDEIAAVTERALGTVKTGYREAIKKLRQVASEKGWH